MYPGEAGAGALRVATASPGRLPLGVIRPISRLPGSWSLRPGRGRCRPGGPPPLAVRRLSPGLGAVAHHPGRRGLQTDELADRLPRASLGPRLEQASQQDQREDHADRLEVDLAHVAGEQAGRHGDDQALAIGGDRPQRIEAVHVGAGVLHPDVAGFAALVVSGTRHLRRGPTRSRAPTCAGSNATVTRSEP